MSSERKSDGPVALITGGSRGIGLGVARSLAREGCRLAIGGRRKADDVADAMESLRRDGAEVLYVRGDIGDAGDRHRLVETVMAEYGGIDVLVNNAGMAPRERRDILEASEESFEELMKVNLQGPYFLTQDVARRMIAADPPAGRRRSIVFITSVSAELATTSRGEYCISKAGLAMAARLWSVRLADDGIGVYEIRPGIIATDMTAGVRDKYDTLLSGGLTLQKRWGEAGDVGRAVASLVRGDWAYSTGQVIYVDGGMTVGRL